VQGNKNKKSLETLYKLLSIALSTDEEASFTIVYDLG
jgi:hypothetical protein